MCILGGEDTADTFGGGAEVVQDFRSNVVEQPGHLVSGRGAVGRGSGRRSRRAVSLLAAAGRAACVEGCRCGVRFGTGMRCGGGGGRNVADFVPHFVVTHSFEEISPDGVLHTTLQNGCAVILINRFLYKVIQLSNKGVMMGDVSDA